MRIDVYPKFMLIFLYIPLIPLSSIILPATTTITSKGIYLIGQLFYTTRSSNFHNELVSVPLFQESILRFDLLFHAGDFEFELIRPGVRKLIGLPPMSWTNLIAGITI